MNPVTALLLLALVCAVGLCATTTVALRRTRHELAVREAELAALATAAPEPESLTRRAADLAVRAVVTTAKGVRDQGVGGFLTSSIEELTGWSLAARRTIEQIAGPDGTVTVMFSDIRDSTALNEHLGDSDWLDLLAAHDDLVRRCVDQHRGQVVKHQGDGFMVVFGTAHLGVAAASQIQAALTEPRRKVLRRQAISVRIGLHTGPTVERDGDFFGRNVAYAARVAACAGGGEVLVSDDVHDLLAEHDWFGDAREVDLKGFPGPHRIWEVRWPLP